MSVFAPMSMPRVGSSRSRTPGSVWSHWRGRPSAGCRRRACARRRPARSARAEAPGDVFGGAAPAARLRIQPPRRVSAAGSPAYVGHDQLRHQPGALRSLVRQHHPRAIASRGRRARTGSPVERDAARRGPAEAPNRPCSRSLAPEPWRPADAEDLAGVHGRTRRRPAGRAAGSATARSTHSRIGRAAGGGRRGETAVDLPPHHPADQPAVGVRGRGRPEWRRRAAR